MRRIKPDPLFQRRLRGQVMNRYVATREGMVAATAPPGLPRRQMGLLGRGVLYASLLTAVSVTAVGAAAQESLPGDPLYGVKIELESIRMYLAPTDMRDDLARMALDERLDEVEALAAAGRWAQLDQAVAAVERAEAALQLALGVARSEPRCIVCGSRPHGRARRSPHRAADDSTQRSKRGLQRALAASGGTPSATSSNRDQPTGNSGQRKGQQVVPAAPTATPRRPRRLPRPRPRRRQPRRRPRQRMSKKASRATAGRAGPMPGPGSGDAKGNGPAQ